MLSYFKKTTPQALMAEELQNAERLLLEALSGLEWATSQVCYNQARVARLTVCLAAANPDKAYTLSPPEMPVIKTKRTLQPLTA